MVDPPLLEKTETKKKSPIGCGATGCILILLFALFLVWMTTQTQSVTSRNGSMSGMNQSMTEISPTSMPDSMPGMNH